VSRSPRSVVASVIPPLVFGVGFLLIWETAVKVFDFQPYFLPAPSAIWSAFRENTELIWEATKVSGLNALVGLVVGTALGVLISFALARFRLLNDVMTPLSVALNAVPIFVLVALFNNMYPVTSEVPRRLMVTLVVYFIVLVNVARGLREVFTALRIAAPASVITAFVSEYFGGSQNGLGNRIVGNIALSNNAEAWAYVLGACLLGLSFFLVALVLERVATPGGVGARERVGA
jgi:NitT/TauT family transport system permease protein